MAAAAASARVVFVRYRANVGTVAIPPWSDESWAARNTSISEVGPRIIFESRTVLKVQSACPAHTIPRLSSWARRRSPVSTLTSAVPPKAGAANAHVVDAISLALAADEPTEAAQLTFILLGARYDKFVAVATVFEASLAPAVAASKGVAMWRLSRASFAAISCRGRGTRSPSLSDGGFFPQPDIVNMGPARALRKVVNKLLRGASMHAVVSASCSMSRRTLRK